MTVAEFLYHKIHNIMERRSIMAYNEGIIRDENGLINGILFNIQKAAGRFKWQVFDKSNKFYREGYGDTVDEAKAEAERIAGCAPAWIGNFTKTPESPER